MTLSELSPRFAPIGGLLFPSRPSAIFRAIVAVVVDAINRVTGRRARTHVQKERFKFIPSIADANPASSVVTVCAAVGVSATVPQRQPGVVLRGFCSSMTESLCPDALVAIAAARDLFTSLQGCGVRDRFLAAIACAKPSPVTVWAGSFIPNSDESSESLTVNVRRLHIGNYTPICIVLRGALWI